MEKKFKKGDSVKIVSSEELLEILNRTCHSNKHVQDLLDNAETSRQIGESEGVIYDTSTSKEDHFLFQMVGDYFLYCLPYLAIAESVS